MEQDAAKRYMKWIFIVLVLVSAAYRLVEPEPITYPERYQIENFPLIAQPDEISCGPTSCVMVLKYFHINQSIETIKEKAHTQWFHYKTALVGMSTPEYLQQALAECGLPCHLKQGRREDIVAAINAKKPPVLLLRSGKQYWHYVVAIGYTEKTIVLADPGGGQLTVLSWSVFEDAWNFSRDMDGVDTREQCPVCGGDGHISPWPGQLGYCDFCAGQGKVMDLYCIALEFAEVQGNTMILPD